MSFVTGSSDQLQSIELVCCITTNKANDCSSGIQPLSPEFNTQSYTI